MGADDRGQRSTIVNWVAVLIILAMVGMMAVPWILRMRENSRLAHCGNNLKQIGLAFHNEHDKFRCLPPSSGVTRDAKTGAITAVDGWSWAAYLLPEWCEEPLWRTLDIANGKPLDGKKPHAEALAMVRSDFRCPSYGFNHYANPVTKTEWITNYKVMGATHHESLSVASPKPMVPKYDPLGKHPDGALFPGAKLSFNDFKNDGTAHTILAAETVEPRFARWTVGAEATLVGLPPIVEFSKHASYYAPVGFNEKYDEQGALDPACRTYLNWNYEEDPYDGAAGFQGGRYGPGSHHLEVTNHLFADGRVHTVYNTIDPALYMFLITRDGGDPWGWLMPKEP